MAEYLAVSLGIELFLMLSGAGFATLIEVSGESSYGVVRSLLGVVDRCADGYG